VRKGEHGVVVSAIGIGGVATVLVSVKVMYSGSEWAGEAL
jgi:hypothetical protein